MEVVRAIPEVLLSVLAVFSAAATVNAVRPFRHTIVLFPALFWSWWVLGLLGQHLVTQVALAGLLVWWGALDSWVGWLALGILAASWVGTGYVMARAAKADEVVDATLAEAQVPRTEHRVPRWRNVVAFPIRGRHVAVTRNVVFRKVDDKRLRLDVFHGEGDGGKPVLVYVHGGAWVTGSRLEQGLPMLHHLARAGWVCFSVSYRLSPKVAWPAHLEDVQAAIAWVHEHAAEYGGDPSFLVLAGGSAGGHLTTMATIEQTPETRVDVAVPIYGVYDLTNRMGVQSKQFVPLLMEPLVMQAKLADEPERFAAASPMDLVRDGLPPFVVVQGDMDTLAPVEEARAFVDQLREAGTDVAYMEFPGAQHVFDLGYSYQSSQMIEGVLSLLEAKRTGR